MKKIMLALAAVAMLASSALAASTTNKSFSTHRKAALAGGAYAFSKAEGTGRYKASNVKISRAVDTRGTKQSFLVRSKDGRRQKSVKTIETAGGIKAYVPNRNVFTPYSAYLVK